MSCFEDGVQEGVDTVFTVTFLKCDGSALDISGATTKEIVFIQPGGTSSSNAADFVTDGTDGKLTYTEQPNGVGTWKIQGHVILSGGRVRWTTIDKFTVFANLG